MGTLKVGITGMAGFIGSHLRDRLIREQSVCVVPFEDSYFEQPALFAEFVAGSDVLVHLAAVNRADPDELYKINVRLVEQLVGQMESLKVRPHVIFSSSIQSSLNNPYGRSKKRGEEILAHWAKKNDAPVTVLTIPNVYGDGCRPHYNSVVATFCHEIANGGACEIKVDKELDLIYINELTEVMWNKIQNPPEGFENVMVQGTARIKVSDILSLLQNFRQCYFDKKMVPAFNNLFERNLYNVFLTYLQARDREQKLVVREDARGGLFEIVKQAGCGQIFYSTTKPGITRGNHYHTRKMEKFCVVGGEAVIKMRRIGTSAVSEYKVSGHNPVIVEMPIFHTHNITNVGREDLHTFFWTNEMFDPADSDTFYEEV